MAREADVVRSLVEMADTLVDDFDVVDLPTGLTDRCVRLLTDAAQAAIDGTLDPQAWARPAAQHRAQPPDGPACGEG